jgi:hypothetical protein
MASKAERVPSRRKAASAPATNVRRRERLNDVRAKQAVEVFRTSSKGFRTVFTGHFPEKLREVEALAFHLAQIEAQLPNTVEAIRLARYPRAGRRNPKRMALGLCENLSVLHTHVARSIQALEKIANGVRRARATAARE